MSTQVQFRRGTTLETTNFTGASGEVTVDTTKNVCVVHDASKAGGYPLMREDGVNSALALGSPANCSLKFVNNPGTGIYSPGVDQVAIATAGVQRFLIDSSGNTTYANSLTATSFIPTGSSAPINGLYLPGANQVALSTAGTGRLFVDASGNVGIGSSNPVFLADILSGLANTGANVNNPSQLSVTGPSKSLTGGGATVFISSNSNFAIDTGGSIAFTGRNTTSSTNSVVWGVIKGAKENATSTNTAGYLAFASANHAVGGLVEAMRIDSSQRVGIGTTSPSQLLHLAANNCNLYLQPVSNAEARIQAEGGTAGTGTAITFHNYNGSANGERARIDSSGRLLVGTTNQDVGGTVTGIKLAPEGQVFASSDTATLGLNNPFYGDRRNTAGDGPVYVLARHGYYKAAIGCTNGGGIANEGALTFYTGTNSGFNERLRITGNGALGLGTSSPTALFHVNGSSSGRIALFSTGTVYQDIALSGTTDAGNGTIVISPVTLPGSGTAEFYTYFKKAVSGVSTTNHNVIIDGKVGIGTTAPTNRLTIRASSDDGIALTRPSDPATTHLLISTTEGGGDAYSVKYETSNNNQIFSTSTASGTGGNIIFRTSTASPSVERVRIDSSGRLLVGTSSTSSSALLQVQGNSSSSTGDAIIQLRRGENNVSIINGESLGSIQFSNSESTVSAVIEAVADANWNTTNDYPSRLVFSTTADGASSPTERMRISSTGTHDLYGLNDTIYSRTNRGAGTTYVTFAGVHSATGTGTGTASCYIYSNGNIQNTNGSYTTLSDVKLKENIVDAGSQWDDLKAIQIRNWNFKAETGHETHRQIGPIAQELETVCPGLVFETPDRDADGNETGEVTKGVNQSVLYMKAVKALQEAMERIETLEAKVAALESK